MCVTAPDGQAKNQDVWNCVGTCVLRKAVKMAHGQTGWRLPSQWFCSCGARSGAQDPKAFMSDLELFFGEAQRESLIRSRGMGESQMGVSRVGGVGCRVKCWRYRRCKLKARPSAAWACFIVAKKCTLDRMRPCRCYPSRDRICVGTRHVIATTSQSVVSWPSHQACDAQSLYTRVFNRARAMRRGPIHK